MKKKIIVVGSTGTIGKEIVSLFSPDYEVITINRHSGDYKADIQDPESLKKVFQEIGSFDGLISASGVAKWAPMAELTLEDYKNGVESKMLGQLALVYIGRQYANPKAAFVLTSGEAATHPMFGSTLLSMINAGLNAFVKAAALELSDFRINIVSPSFAKETMEMMGLDSSDGIPAADFARLYKHAIEEHHSGKVYRISDLD